MSDLSASTSLRAWAEIDLSALRANMRVAREVSGCGLMVVVKADAYGHGLGEIVRQLEGEEIVFLGVANVAEARKIRSLGVMTPIYLLGATWAGEREEIVAQGWTPCLSSIEEAEDFDRLAKRQGERLRVHVAVDTGMGRGGFLPEELFRVMEDLDRLEWLEIEGVGSHLPSADEDRAFTMQQIDVFGEVVSRLGGEGRFKWRHLLNSAGLLGYEQGVCNLVRPGLMLYGTSPLPDFQAKLKNVMTLKARVTLVRWLPAGHGVSYGRQFVTERPTRVATLGLGYGDGYPRHISGRGGEVWVRGVRCPILGRVTMDQMMVDVSAVPEVVMGDEVEVFGANLPVSEVATKAQTIPWEIYTGIAPRVQRIYVE